MSKPPGRGRGLGRVSRRDSYESDEEYDRNRNRNREYRSPSNYRRRNSPRRDDSLERDDQHENRPLYNFRPRIDSPEDEYFVPERTTTKKGCHRCGRIGHTRRTCKFDQWCYHCRKDGHYSYDCPDYEEDERPKRPSPKPKAPFRPYTHEEAMENLRRDADQRFNELHRSSNSSRSLDRTDQRPPQNIEKSSSKSLERLPSKIEGKLNLDRNVERDTIKKIASNNEKSVLEKKEKQRTEEQIAAERYEQLRRKEEEIRKELDELDRQRQKKENAKASIKSKFNMAQKKFNDAYEKYLAARTEMNTADENRTKLATEYQQIWNEFPPNFVNRSTSEERTVSNNSSPIERRVTFADQSTIKPSTIEDVIVPKERKTLPDKQIDLNEALEPPLPPNECISIQTANRALRSAQLMWHLPTNTILAIPPGFRPPEYAPIYVRPPNMTEIELSSDSDENLDRTKYDDEEEISDESESAKSNLERKPKRGTSGRYRTQIFGHKFKSSADKSKRSHLPQNDPSDTTSWKPTPLENITISDEELDRNPSKSQPAPSRSNTVEIEEDWSKEMEEDPAPHFHYRPFYAILPTYVDEVIQSAVNRIHDEIEKKEHDIIDDDGIEPDMYLNELMESFKNDTKYHRSEGHRNLDLVKEVLHELIYTAERLRIELWSEVHRVYKLAIKESGTTEEIHRQTQRERRWRKHQNKIRRQQAELEREPDDGIEIDDQNDDIELDEHQEEMNVDDESNDSNLLNVD